VATADGSSTVLVLSPDGTIAAATTATPTGGSGISSHSENGSSDLRIVTTATNGTLTTVSGDGRTITVVGADGSTTVAEVNADGSVSINHFDHSPKTPDKTRTPAQSRGLPLRTNSPSCSSIDLQHPANIEWAVFCGTKQEAVAKSALLMAVPFAISIVASPFVGYAVGRYGGRNKLALLAPLLLLGAHLLFALAPNFHPLFPLIAIGLAYSIFTAALWPSVPLCVDPSHVGSAFGAITAMQNLVLAILPVAVGICERARDPYLAVELMLSAIAGVGVLVGCSMNYVGAINDESHLGCTACTPPYERRAKANSTTTQVVSPTQLTECGETNPLAPRHHHDHHHEDEDKKEVAGAEGVHGGVTDFYRQCGDELSAQVVPRHTLWL
jgi:hypothetical protein